MPVRIVTFQGPNGPETYTVPVGGGAGPFVPPIQIGPAFPNQPKPDASAPKVLPPSSPANTPARDPTLEALDRFLPFLQNAFGSGASLEDIATPEQSPAIIVPGDESGGGAMSKTRTLVILGGAAVVAWFAWKKLRKAS